MGRQHLDHLVLARGGREHLLPGHRRSLGLLDHPGPARDADAPLLEDLPEDRDGVGRRVRHRYRPPLVLGAPSDLAGHDQRVTVALALHTDPGAPARDRAGFVPQVHHPAGHQLDVRRRAHFSRHDPHRDDVVVVRQGAGWRGVGVRDVAGLPPLADRRTLEVGGVSHQLARHPADPQRLQRVGQCLPHRRLGVEESGGKGGVAGPVHVQVPLEHAVADGTRGRQERGVAEVRPQLLERGARREQLEVRRRGERDVRPVREHRVAAVQRHDQHAPVIRSPAWRFDRRSQLRDQPVALGRGGDGCAGHRYGGQESGGEDSVHSFSRLPFRSIGTLIGGARSNPWRGPRQPRQDRGAGRSFLSCQP